VLTPEILPNYVYHFDHLFNDSNNDQNMHASGRSKRSLDTCSKTEKWQTRIAKFRKQPDT